MNIVKLSGGLGNQMFQYAFAKSVAEDRSPVALDISMMKYSPGRKLAINSLTMDESLYFIEYPYDTSMRMQREQRYFSFDLTYKTISRHENIYFDGSWQSPKYHSPELISKLKHDFYPKEGFSTGGSRLIEKMGRERRQGIKLISVHLRRGDFLNPQTMAFHGCLTNRFFEHCIERALDEIPGKKKIYLFCEDKTYPLTLKISPSIPSEIVKAGKLGKIEDVEEIFLMAKCNCNILSNSSFSWWGASLNLKKDKKVYAPAYWIKDTSYMGIHPPGWKLVNNRSPYDNFTIFEA